LSASPGHSPASPGLPAPGAVRRVAADLTRLGSALADLELPAAAGGVVLTEGVLQYLPPAVVSALAEALAADGRCAYWLTDLVSPDSAGWMSGRLGALGAPAVRVEHTGSLLEAHGFTPVRLDPLPIELRAMGSASPLARALPSTRGCGTADAVALLRRA
jgi:O-methyltransferase involved in polyketide biosynthesis